MKKFSMMLAGLFFMAVAGVAYATPIMIDVETTISADDNGVVKIFGSTKLVRAVQYCSDEVNDDQGCPKNIVIPISAGGFQLNVEGLRVGQNVFNCQYQKFDDWLWIPNAKVKIGNNLKLIRLRGGAGIQYTGPMPK